MIRAHDLGELTALAMSRFGELDTVRAEREASFLTEGQLALAVADAQAQETAIGLDQRRVNALTNGWNREATEAGAQHLFDAARNPDCDFDSVAQLYAKARMKPKLGADAVSFIVTKLMPAQRLTVLTAEFEHARQHEQTLLYDALVARLEAAHAVQGLLDAEGPVEISGGRSEYLFRLALDAGRRTRACSQSIVDESTRQAEMARSGAIASL